MHKNITHNRTYPTFRDFADKASPFLTERIPNNWPAFCDSVTDNFRVINPSDFRVLR